MAIGRLLGSCQGLWLQVLLHDDGNNFIDELEKLALLLVFEDENVFIIFPDFVFGLFKGRNIDTLLKTFIRLVLATERSQQADNTPKRHFRNAFLVQNFRVLFKALLRSEFRIKRLMVGQLPKHCSCVQVVLKLVLRSQLVHHFDQVTLSDFVMVE